MQELKTITVATHSDASLFLECSIYAVYSALSYIKWALYSFYFRFACQTNHCAAGIRFLHSAVRLTVIHLTAFNCYDTSTIIFLYVSRGPCSHTSQVLYFVKPLPRQE